MVSLLFIARSHSYYCLTRCTKLWWESTEEKDHSEDQDVDGRMGSKWIFGKLAGRGALDSLSSGQRPVARSCRHGNEPSGSRATKYVGWLVTVSPAETVYHCSD
jgi:hypothetical protein